jgi:hypothetical protein
MAEDPSDEAAPTPAPVAVKKKPAARKKAPPVKAVARKAPVKAAVKKAPIKVAPKPPARKAAPAKRSGTPRAAAA